MKKTGHKCHRIGDGPCRGCTPSSICMTRAVQMHRADPAARFNAEPPPAPGGVRHEITRQCLDGLCNICNEARAQMGKLPTGSRRKGEELPMEERGVDLPARFLHRPETLLSATLAAKEYDELKGRGFFRADPDRRAPDHKERWIRARVRREEK